MKVFYWSPHIDRVATIKAVINSAYSMNLYSKQKFIPYLINVAGEWDNYKKEIKKKNINIINITNSKIIKNNTKGFIKSRLVYIYIFFISFLPLLKLIKEKKPDYFIIHLITPVPLIINFLFNFNCKFILRISGYPKLKKLRLLFWKLVLKKIYYITCPTTSTKKLLISLKLADKKKISVLYDPIICSKDISKELNLDNKKIEFKNFFLSVGRLTKQKNFLFLVDAFKEFNQGKNYKLLILGDGEQKEKIQNFIKLNNLEKTIFLLGYKKNVFKFYKNSKCFILSSLWEDPGFVLVEAAYMNTPIISSDCQNGPKEFLNNGEGGILYNSNNKKSLINSLLNFENLSKEQVKNFKINSKKSSKKFLIFNHYKTLANILNLHE